MTDRRANRFGRKLTGFIITALLIGLALFERQNIYDFYRMRTYQPSLAISTLTSDDQMTALARKYFYVMHAQLDDKAAFNFHCSKDFEKTIVLGCYKSRQGIYILDVTDVRLDGVEQVTAAHEMLHEAYERLNVKERTRVDSLTSQAYSSINSADLKQKIELYRKQGAAIIPSELHSILGTEYSNLAADLENYYAQYFINRQSVVAFAKKYNDAFEQRRITVNQFDAQLQALKNQIESLDATVKNQSKNLSIQRSNLNKLSDNHQTAAFNNAVPAFNAQVADYNNNVNHLQSLVEQYNVIVKERNAIATEESQLMEAIDSHTQTPGI